MKFYRCMKNYCGESFIINTGGYFEKIDKNGYPVKLGGDLKGYRKSETPQACFSKTPEGCLFASLQGSENNCKRYIYKGEAKVNHDLSNAISGDFSIIEEVRIDNPSKNPIETVHHKSIDVPEIAVQEVNMCYQEGDFILKIAEKVKQELKTLIETGNYSQSLDDGWHKNY